MNNVKITKEKRKKGEYKIFKNYQISYNYEKMATNEENKDVYETYKKDCIYSVDEFLKIHNFSERGLTKGQVEENKTKYGLNIIKQSKPKNGITFY